MYFGVFATLPGTREVEIRYPDQLSTPVPLLAQVPPGSFQIRLKSMTIVKKSVLRFEDRTFDLGSLTLLTKIYLDNLFF